MEYAQLGLALFVQPIPSFHRNHCQINPISKQLMFSRQSCRCACPDRTLDILRVLPKLSRRSTRKPGHNACSSLNGRGRRSAACDYTMDVLGLTKVTLRLTTGEAIVITLFFLLIWFAGYMTGAEVTRIWEKTGVVYDCIFLPAPENSSRV